MNPRQILKHYAANYDKYTRGYAGDPIRKAELRFIQFYRLKGPVLDYGCGTGQLLEILEPYQGEGYEPNEDMRKIAATRGIVHADVPRKTYNTIFLIEVLQEVPIHQHYDILKDAVKHLRAKGTMYLVFMNSYNPLSLLVDRKDHVHSTPYHKMRHDVESLGLTIVRESGVQILPLPKRALKIDLKKPVWLAKWVMWECEKI